MKLMTTIKNIISKIENIKFSGFIGSKEEDTVDFIIEAEDGADIRGDIFSAFAAAEVPLFGLKSAELSLEEIFIRLTTDAAYITEEDDEKQEEQNKKSGFFDKLFAKNKKDLKNNKIKSDGEKNENSEEAKEEEKVESDIQ